MVSVNFHDLQSSGWINYITWNPNKTNILVFTDHFSFCIRLFVPCWSFPVRFQPFLDPPRHAAARLSAARCQARQLQALCNKQRGAHHVNTCGPGQKPRQFSQKEITVCPKKPCLVICPISTFLFQVVRLENTDSMQPFVTDTSGLGQASMPTSI